MRAPRDARIVVIRHRSKYTGAMNVLAWLIRECGDGTATVRRRMGGPTGGYLPKVATIGADQLLRDATPRERTPGRPVEGTP